ncbi:GNAT family N-acetyltransferase [Neobacillus rhizosphaerae]|nr:GNAT family N-acetyltransferase [Neobacillus rhizosphaerae]
MTTEDCRGNGLGKLVVKEAFHLYKNKGLDKMIVGTANSSIDNLAFYQKLGFRMVEIKKDFFKNYPEPIFENGIRALDMVMFEKDL